MCKTAIQNYQQFYFQAKHLNLFYVDMYVCIEYI